MNLRVDPGSVVTVEVVTDPAALEQIKGEWGTLLLKGHTRTVELSYEWQMTFWKNFHNGKSSNGGKSSGQYPKLFVLVARNADTLVGIAPMKISRSWKKGFPGRVLEFIAALESNYQDFIVDPDAPGVLQAMIDCLIANKKQWDMMHLRHVPETSPTLEFLTNSGFCRWCHRRVIQRKRTVSLTIASTWDEFSNTISGRARWKIRNRTKKLAKVGDIRTFHCSTENEFLAHMPKFFELHRKRWNETGSPSNFNDHRYCSFYLDVIPQLFPKKQVDLYVMEAGETTLAMIFSFLLQNNYLTQLTIYDTDFEKNSPSIIVQDRLVEESFDGEIEVLDFGDHYAFKEMWARESSYKVSMEFYPRKTVRSLLLYCFTAIAEPARGLLRMVTPLRKIVVRIRQYRGRDAHAERR